MFDDFDAEITPEEFYGDSTDDLCGWCGYDLVDCRCDDDADPGWADGDLETGLESVYGPEDDGRYDYEY